MRAYISKADARTLTEIPVSQKYTMTTGEKAIGTAGMPSDTDIMSYAKGTAATTGSVSVTDWNVDATGKVTYTLSGAAAGDTVTLPVVIASTNYENSTLNVKILSKRRDYTAALKKAEGAEFLAKNSRKDSVQVTESGLQYIIREAGNDVKPGPKDTVFVHYKGSLIDGTVFDESPKSGDGVQLTLNHVVAGWTEGLQLIGEGGKMKLFIPSVCRFWYGPLYNYP